MPKDKGYRLWFMLVAASDHSSKINNCVSEISYLKYNFHYIIFKSDLLWVPKQEQKRTPGN